MPAPAGRETGVLGSQDRRAEAPRHHAGVEADVAVSPMHRGAFVAPDLPAPPAFDALRLAPDGQHHLGRHTDLDPTRADEIARATVELGVRREEGLAPLALGRRRRTVAVVDEAR